MNRLLWVVAGLAMAGGVASAQPPAGAGKERTLLEQEFFLGEPTQAVATKPPPIALELPKVSPSILGEVRNWLVSATVGRLGTSPLVRPEVW